MAARTRACDGSRTRRGRTAAPPFACTLRQPETARRVDARRLVGARRSQIAVVPHGVRARRVRRRPPPVRLETARGEGGGNRNDARRGRLQLDARRGFLAEPSRPHAIFDRQTLLVADAGPRRHGRLRGRGEGAVAHNVRLPHGEEFRQETVAVARLGAGNRPRTGGVARRAVVLQCARQEPRDDSHHRW